MSAVINIQDLSAVRPIRIYGQSGQEQNQPKRRTLKRESILLVRSSEESNRVKDARSGSRGCLIKVCPAFTTDCGHALDQRSAVMEQSDEQRSMAD